MPEKRRSLIDQLAAAKQRISDLEQAELARVSSHVEISVTDNGIGIRNDFLPYIFNRFSQADASPTRTYGGLGLGLAITKSIVELHGGSIAAGYQMHVAKPVEPVELLIVVASLAGHKEV